MEPAGAIVREQVAVPTGSARARREFWTLAVVLAGAVVVRAAVLNARSLWFDETFSVAVARLPWLSGLRLIAQTDAHPPLYYMLLHLWVKMGDSPEVVRALSALFGTLTVLATWFFARALGGRTLAAVAGTIVASSTLAIQASVEARMFSLLSLLAVVSSHALWAAARGPARSRWWVAYAGASAVGLYTSYLFALLLPAHLLYMLVTQRANRPAWRAYLLALAVVGLLCLPWLPAFSRQVAVVRLSTAWRATVTVPLSLRSGLDMLALSSFGGYLLGFGAYLYELATWSWWQLLLLPFLALAVLGTARLPRGAGILLFAGFALPIALLVGVSAVTGVSYARPRYIAFVQPLFALILAQGILALSALRRSASRRALTGAALTLAVVLLNLTVLGLVSTDARYQPFNWAGAAAFVRDQWQQGDAIIFYPHTNRVAFGYYFRQAGVNAVTLYPPPWTGTPSRAELVRAFPSLPVLVRQAERVWLVLGDPVPPAGSREALLEVTERSYRREQARDFGHVYVLLYTRR